jgi:hypothetical protein
MPHKDPEARKRYRAENKERIAAAHKTYYETNKEKILEYNREYEAANKERRRAIDDRKDPEKQRAKWRRYAKENKEKLRDYDRQRQADPVKRAIRAEQARKRRALDPGRIRNRENARRQKTLEMKAGRPKPDRCEICGATHRKIMWDHCHQRGHFRGWVCQPCNIIMGMAEDDPRRLLQVIAYLETDRTMNDW